MRYELCKFRENRATDTSLKGVYIPNFGKISVKISVFGVYTLIVAPMRVKSQSVQRVAPAGEKPQNRP